MGRAKFLTGHSIGLTEFYNLLAHSKNDELTELRFLQLELDRAVLAAYGWSDIEVPPYTDPVTPAEKAAHEAFADEIIDRLFALNAERAAEEANAADPLAKPKKKPPKSKKKPSTDQGDLF